MSGRSSWMWSHTMNELWAKKEKWRKKCSRARVCSLTHRHIQANTRPPKAVERWKPKFTFHQTARIYYKEPRQRWKRHIQSQIFRVETTNLSKMNSFTAVSEFKILNCKKIKKDSSWSVLIIKFNDKINNGPFENGNSVMAVHISLWWYSIKTSRLTSD